MPELTPRNFQSPLIELAQLRRKKFPGVSREDFAKKLGISRMHMLSVERGRRRPSMDLLLRWLALLAPEAKIAMFGDLPVISRRMRALKRLQKAA